MRPASLSDNEDLQADSGSKTINTEYTEIFHVYVENYIQDSRFIYHLA